MTLLNAARLAPGAVALLQPRRVAAWWGADPGSRDRLGGAGARARHLAQAVTSTVQPTPGREPSAVPSTSCTPPACWASR